MATAAECSGRRRFAVACGVLSQCVRAEAAARKTAATQLARPLMPGADVALDTREEEPEAAPLQTQAQAQPTITYGGRLLVFDDVTTYRAAELVGRQDASAGGLANILVARKASLRRFMEKRQERLDERAPYAARALPSPVPKVKEEEADVGCWLGLGNPGAYGR